MASIHFHSTRDITEEQLLHGIQHLIPATRVEWIKDFYKYDGDFVSNTLYVVREDAGGQFKFGYEVHFLPGERWPTVQDTVGVLQKLAKQFAIPTLTPSEEIDPYVFISIEDDGYTYSVGVGPVPYNDRDELSIEGPYNFSFGGFALQAPLSYSEEKQLAKLFDGLMARFNIIPVGTDIFSPDFRNYKTTSIPLKNYDYYYMIVPDGKTTWYSIEERSRLFLEQMTTFSRESNKNVCLFPANSTTVENIPGGSDSESTCINITNTSTEKITYKPRRKSWD